MMEARMSRGFSIVVELRSAVPTGDQVQLGFQPDYNDNRNKEWAQYTPSLNLGMTVTQEVFDRIGFHIGDRFVGSFQPAEVDPALQPTERDAFRAAEQAQATRPTE
jgi:hypothetical protein